jgi:hypothetical protein
MGNNSSTLKNKSSLDSSQQKMTSTSQDIKKLAESNSKFLSKLNDIAINYILGQNFQDMIRLTNSKYCDDLVIITSKLLKKSYSDQEIHYAYQKIFDKGVGVGLGVGQDINEVTMFLNKRDAVLEGIMSVEQKKKMCIDIAKYYVKIAHLFAAIITTLNPVFSWRSSASSSRALLRPHVTEEKRESEEHELGPEPQPETGLESVKFTATLEDKHYISEMAQDIKVENLNFCNSRISDLMDMEEITDLMDGKNIIPDGAEAVSTIKIKTNLCSSNLNNNNEGYSRKKTVYDLPGFAELSRLYYDRYNASKGRFDRMSSESEEEKKRNVALLYTLFTGDKNPPKDIKSFKDIPLHSFLDDVECENMDSIFNKTYMGTTKDKLFVDYVDMVKKMIYDSNMIRNSLLEIIDKIFIINDGASGVQGSADEETKEKYVIDHALTYEELDILIVEARKIILKLYISCERDFMGTLKIFQAIIETQILETNKRQIKELETGIEMEYAA